MDHINLVPRSLHWFPLCQRIHFKKQPLVYEVLNGFISDPTPQLVQNRSAFRFYAPLVWNKLSAFVLLPFIKSNNYSLPTSHCNVFCCISYFYSILVFSFPFWLFKFLTSLLCSDAFYVFCKPLWIKSLLKCVAQIELTFLDCIIYKLHLFFYIVKRSSQSMNYSVVHFWC